MGNYVIFCFSGPYSHERAYTALRFAYTALTNDHKVKIFFFEDGIFNVKKGQNPANIYNINEWVQKCIAEDGCEIAACGVCLKARGVETTELLQKVKVGTMEMALQWVSECDKQVSF